MESKAAEYSTSALTKEHVGHLLDLLSGQGMTQVKVASKAGLPAQYLSDIKQGRRPMTELVARRLGEEFDVNFQWLLGTSGTMENPKPHSSASPTGSNLWIPLFPHPIAGEPRAHPDWDGAGVEVAGAAAARLLRAKFPYVLQYGHDDIEGRLQQGDLILVSQAPVGDTEISVISYRKKSFLARRSDKGGWIRVANGKELSADCPIAGHCIGIIWSSLS